MKTIPLLFLAVTMALSSAAQTDAQRIDMAKALMSRQQYLSAFDTLSGCKQTSEDALSLAFDLMIHHNSGYNKYMSKFKLTNTVDGRVVATDDIDFEAESMLAVCIERYPNNCVFYSYMYEVYNMVVDVEDRYTTLETLSAIKSALKTTISNKCADHLAFYLAGYSNIYLNHPDSAVSFLQRSIALNKNFLQAYLELGQAYLLTGNKDAALSNAKQAFSLSKKTYDKSKAALLLGNIYEALHDNGNALNFYVMADSLVRKDFFNLKGLLNFYVKTGNSKAEETLSLFLGSQGRESLYNYDDVIQIYTANKKENDLAAYCAKAIVQFGDRPAVVACINFTLGKLYEKSTPQVAAAYFKKAKEGGIKADKYEFKRNHPFTGQMIEAAFKNLN